MSESEPNKEAEAQNQQLQEEARQQIEEAAKKQQEAAVKVAQGEAEEPDYTFQAAAKALEELEQPPNMGSAVEDKARAEDKGEPPPAGVTTAPMPPPTGE